MKHSNQLYLIDIVLFCIKIYLQMMMELLKLRAFQSILSITGIATDFIYISKNWDK